MALEGLGQGLGQGLVDMVVARSMVSGRLSRYRRYCPEGQRIQARFTVSGRVAVDLEECPDPEKYGLGGPGQDIVELIKD